MTLFAVARILKSIGLKGSVKIEPLTHSRGRFEHLREVYVGKDDRQTRRMSVDNVKTAQNGILLKLHMIDDRTASDTLVNHFLFVDETNLLPPPRGSYFIHDIIGCHVWMKNNQIGRVVEIYLQSQGMAQDVWVVESKDKNAVKQYWLPAVGDFIEEVDIDRRKILVRRLDEFTET